MSPRQPFYVVVVGGSSAIGLACLDEWIRRGARRVALVGRRESSLGRAAADLRVRRPAVEFEVVVGDIETAQGVFETVAKTCQDLVPDRVVIAQGLLPDQSHCETDLVPLSECVTVNALSPVMCAEAFAGRMASAGGGVLVVLGSVAGDRGRRSNYVYGASKALVECFVEGLQHRFARSSLRVVLAKPGPTASAMTRHLLAQGKRVAPADQVGTRIVCAAESGRAAVYAPGVWRWIMLVIRFMPKAIFNRLSL